MGSAPSIPRTAAPSVCILVLNYNGLRELTECLDSLHRTDYPNLTTTVIDNGSTDCSVSHVREEFPRVRIIGFDRNYGFGRAYNMAVERVDSKYVLLLNNDITISNRDWLYRMVELAEVDQSIGVVGPKLVVASNHRLLDAVGGTVYRWMGCSPLGHGEEDKNQFDHPAREPFYMGGGALLIRRELYNQIGGFDQNIFAYAEDLDLCWRLRLIGYHVTYCPDAVLFHKGSSLWKKFTSKKLLLSQQNFLYCCLKNYSVLSILREVPFFIILNIVGSLATSFVDRRADLFVAVVKSLTANLLRAKTIILSRSRTQLTRRVSEASILAEMGPQRLMSLKDMKTKRSGFVLRVLQP